MCDINSKCDRKLNPFLPHSLQARLAEGELPHVEVMRSAVSLVLNLSPGRRKGKESKEILDWLCYTMASHILGWHIMESDTFPL